jgi:hypothetical protein
MSDITKFDPNHPVGKKMLDAAQAGRSLISLLKEHERIRAEAVAVGPAEITSLFGCVLHPQAFSDRLSAVNAGAGTLAAFQEFIDLIQESPPVA